MPRRAKTDRLDTELLKRAIQYDQLAGTAHAHPTYADAILDRLIHNAHRIDLAGDSLRRTRPRSAVKD
jgi:DNA replication protein DnaC